MSLTYLTEEELLKRAADRQLIVSKAISALESHINMCCENSRSTPDNWCVGVTDNVNLIFWLHNIKDATTCPFAVDMKIEDAAKEVASYLKVERNCQYVGESSNGETTIVYIFSKTEDSIPGV